MVMFQICDCVYVRNEAIFLIFIKYINLKEKIIIAMIIFSYRFVSAGNDSLPTLINDWYGVEMKIQL